MSPMAGSTKTMPKSTVSASGSLIGWVLGCMEIAMESLGTSILRNLVLERAGSRVLSLRPEGLESTQNGLH